MNVERLISRSRPPASEADELAAAPLGGTRAQAMQRLQVGVAGLGAILLMVVLAETIMDRAAQTDAAAVPEAAATVKAEPTQPVQNDPLVDAGVIPDLPAEPTPTAQPTAAVSPERSESGEP